MSKRICEELRNAIPVIPSELLGAWVTDREIREAVCMHRTDQPLRYHWLTPWREHKITFLLLVLEAEDAAET